MKKINITYWISTGLLAALFLMSGIQGVLHTKGSVDLIVTKLQYPDYFLLFNGITKILGAIVILIPGFPILKEWAYAGITFDLVGATYSSIAIGEPFHLWVFMFVFIGILAGSYIFYHKRLNALSENNLKTSMS